MLTDCAEDASVAVCENAQAFQFMFRCKRIDRNIYETSVESTVSVRLNYSTSFRNDDFSSFTFVRITLSTGKTVAKK